MQLLAITHRHGCDLGIANIAVDKRREGILLPFFEILLDLLSSHTNLTTHSVLCLNQLGITAGFSTSHMWIHVLYRYACCYE